jgi:RND family efflux transporter MFP subunit
MSAQTVAAPSVHVANPKTSHESAAPFPQNGLIIKRAKIFTICILALLLLGAIGNVAMRASQAHALAESAAEDGRVYVTTTNASAAASSQPLTFPGTLQGIIESPIYARSSGYVVRWNKDIGARVVKGEVLAEIDTPEVDQQLSQAKAAREQAASGFDLAKTSAERWLALSKKDAVTQQELNERTSAFAQAQANLAALDANVKRLQKLEDFKRVVAPFSGVITHRNVDVGDLIDAGNGGAGRALFSMAQVDTLRVYVYVPQAYSQRIKVGDQASVTQTELPGQVFKGTVVRTARSIDAATRTLQIEINLENRDDKLLDGSYVQVALSVSGSANVLTVPSNVLLFRPEGTKIAVVDATGHVKLNTVKIGNDLGNSLEILSGISATDKLVLNPADSLADNDIVIVASGSAPEVTKRASL